MPDVTGRVYESFTEYLLRRANYFPEWAVNQEKTYAFEKHPSALCQNEPGICQHAAECRKYSAENNIEIGPWYDPDFFVWESRRPKACIHVTHWNNPGSSHFKFWRSIEDHWQYKTNFGHRFLSVNFVFEARPANEEARRIVDSFDAIELNGFKPAVGAVFSVSFDSTLLFPVDYAPISHFIRKLSGLKAPSNPRARRLFEQEQWESLVTSEPELLVEIEQATSMLIDALEDLPNPRYSSESVAHMQSVCFAGRKNASAIRGTFSRYRKGLLHLYLIKRMATCFFEGETHSERIVEGIMNSQPEFQWSALHDVLALGESVPQLRALEFMQVLGSTPVKIDKGIPSMLAIPASGIQQAAWDPELSVFLTSLAQLTALEKSVLIEDVKSLFIFFDQNPWLDSVVQDLVEVDRIAARYEYIETNYLGKQIEPEFAEQLAKDFLTPGSVPPHQRVVRDTQNWVGDVLIEVYEVGSTKDVLPQLPVVWEQLYGHSLRNYAFNGNYAALMSHLLQGVEVGQYFSKNASFGQEEFYAKIWPIFAEAIRAVTVERPAQSKIQFLTNYAYKRAQRIIASPDLEPIEFLFHRYFPELKQAERLVGCYAQLSRLRGWSNAALTTDPAGMDPRSGAVIQTQSVMGKKHIADKTKELAGRMRSNFLECDELGIFRPKLSSIPQLAVLDGDWPKNSKLNLLEAGFDSLFEVAQLRKCKDRLRALSDIADSSGDRVTLLEVAEKQEGYVP